MQRWERRLADLAHVLGACGSSYFDPELFRRNTNQFLTTARTVTFLIQKDKSIIPDFDAWYEEAVRRPWSGDPIMKWAIDSRNHIEKVGDLDLYSELSVSLIYSYDEAEDISLKCDRPLVLEANVKRLMRFAEKELPSGVADAAVIKMERRWVANTLPSHELLQAFIYIYSRAYDACMQLAKHLGGALGADISSPTEFDEGVTDSRQVRFVKFADRKSTSYVAKPVLRDPNYVPPDWLVSLVESEGASKEDQTLADNVAFYAQMARGTFEQFGNHMPMLYLFDARGKPVDFLGVIPDDQATKFIFWRSVAERITYLRAASLIWISELWLRRRIREIDTPIRKLPIMGEMLHVVGLDQFGNVESVHWDIVRQNPESKPTLVGRPEVDAGFTKNQIPFFLMPAYRAFVQLGGRQQNTVE